MMSYYMKRFGSAKISLLIVAVLLTGIGARADEQTSKPGATNNAVVNQRAEVDTSQSVSTLLGDQLGPFKAAGALTELNSETLAQRWPAESGLLQEYTVNSAAVREYGGMRAEVFRLQNQFAAFGLFSFELGRSGAMTSMVDQLGSAAVRIDNSICFWKSNFVVRINGASNAASIRASMSLAKAISDAIAGGGNSARKPAIIASLPESGRIADSIRYFIGPLATDAFVEHGREMFPFFGDAEAAFAEYDEGSGQPALRLLIVEYHTPQFATDALNQVSGVFGSLSEDQQAGLIIKRQGNFLIAASRFSSRDHAQGLVDSIEYPYTVKWLRNPLWPTNDPFRAQKAAQMLLSTFGVLGLVLLTVGFGGAAFGMTVFLRRRKQQRQAFSDAGGMLRLEIDPFDSVILGLPPASSNED